MCKKWTEAVDKGGVVVGEFSMMGWVERQVTDHHAGWWRARPRAPLELLVVSAEDWNQLVREVEAAGRLETGELEDAVELTFHVGVQPELVRVRPGLGGEGASSPAAIETDGVRVASGVLGWVPRVEDVAFDASKPCAPDGVD